MRELGKLFLEKSDRKIVKEKKSMSKCRLREMEIWLKQKKD